MHYIKAWSSQRDQTANILRLIHAHQTYYMKMMLRSVSVCVLLVLVPFVLTNPLKVTRPPEELVSIINLEEPCVHQGGLCLLADDCEVSDLVHLPAKLLCPNQAHLGVVCCYG